MADQASDNAFEIELKLQPREARLLDRLWTLDALGPFQVTNRHTEQQHNLFYDSPEHALDLAHGNLRLRVIDDGAEAELTYKGPSRISGGVFHRQEVTVMVPASADPLTLHPEPEPVRLARQVTQRLERTSLVLENRRRCMLLRGLGAEVEMALDMTTMPGTEMLDLEIEGELRSGDASALNALESAIRGIGRVRRSQQGKRARAWNYLMTHSPRS